MERSGVAVTADRGGSQVSLEFVGMLVLSFGIGATLTGAVFMLTEDN
jgi:hypothetical protein